MKIRDILQEQGVREGGRRVDNCVKVGEDRLQEFRDDDDGRRDGGGGEDPDFHSRGSWKLDTRHYNQAIDFYSLFGPDEYEDRWVKDPRSGRVVAWEGWRRDLPDTDALGRSIPGKLRKMAGFRWDDVEDTMDDDAPGTGWYYSWSPDWGDIFKQDRDPKDGVAEAIDIGQEWMTDTELDQYVPDQLQQQWRELVGYDAEGNVSALWANITGGYEPDANDPEDRANMVRVANKWFAMKRIPNVRFFDVRDVGDELEWLVQIG